MLRRWILYLAVASGCMVFYWAYQEWASWFILLGILCLPVAALLMSLPAMINLRLTANCPAFVQMGVPQPLGYTVYSRLPVPPSTCRLRVRRTTTGESWVLKNGDMLPTQHCGQLICRLEKARVYDYLGLFWLKVQRKPAISVIVRPVPIAMQAFPELERHTSAAWRPKPGGGFSENHELRLYRPGDNLNQIHWKLSAKTGKYIIREPMEQEKSRLLLEMELRGSPEELDRKYGRLLWLSNFLLQKGLRHELRVLTGKGIQHISIADTRDLEKAIDMLLCQNTAPEGAQMEPMAASWQYRIGGGEDEG